MVFIETDNGLISSRFIILLQDHEGGYQLQYQAGSETRWAVATPEAAEHFRQAVAKVFGIHL